MIILCSQVFFLLVVDLVVFGVPVKLFYTNFMLVCLHRFKLQMPTRGRTAKFCTGSSLVSAALLGSETRPPCSTNVKRE